MTDCFVCSQRHFEGGVLVPARPDPSQPCEHRDEVSSFRRESAQLERRTELQRVAGILARESGSNTARTGKIAQKCVFDALLYFPRPYELESRLKRLDTCQDPRDSRKQVGANAAV